MSSVAARGAAGYLYRRLRREGYLPRETRDAYRAADALRRERERRNGKPWGKL